MPIRNEYHTQSKLSDERAALSRLWCVARQVLRSEDFFGLSVPLAGLGFLNDRTLTTLPAKISEEI